MQIHIESMNHEQNQSVHQSVVSPFDSVRQNLRIAFVLNVMRNVREEGSLRLQFVDVRKRLFEPQMCFVRADAQTVERQNFQIP